MEKTRLRNLAARVLAAALALALMAPVASAEAAVDTKAAAVTVVKPSSVTLNTTSKVMLPGRTFQFKATLKPISATVTAVTWKSTNKKIATVSSTGLVKAKKPGKCTIVCTTVSGKLKAHATVRVGYDYTGVKYRFYGIVNTEYPSLIGSAPYYDPGASDLDALYADAIGGGPIVLHKLSRNLTGAGIRSYLQTIVNNSHIGEDDVLVFYYAGRGEKSDYKSDRGALVGVDKDYKNNLVTIAEVQSYLDKVPGTVILVLDCSMSGQFIKSKGGRVVDPALTAARFNLDVVNTFSKSPANQKAISGAKKGKYKILTACGAKQNSYGIWDAEEEEGYSYFTKWLVIGLSEAKADKNKDGTVTLREAYSYTKAKVKAEIKKYNKKHRKKRGSQTVCLWPSGDYFPLFMDAGDGADD